jgi:hypothetical protein
MKKLFLLLTLLPLMSTASENIFDKMDKKTAVTTGVTKLSEKEQMALLAWLDSTKKEIIKQEKKKNMGFRKEESGREEIHTAIIGDFNGWQGKNIFKLENGQVWKQSAKNSFYIPKRKNPKVTLKPKSLGSWMLYVDGYGHGVKVKRIK